MRWTSFLVIATTLLAGPAALGQDGAEPAPEPRPPALAQFNVSVIVQGLGAYDDRGWSGGAHLGLRPELHFGRRDGNSFGAGPYVEGGLHLATRGVGATFGGGALLLVPLGRSNALVPSLGGYASWQSELGLQPGVTAGLFLGARQFNPTTRFDGAWGLRLDFRYGLGSAHEVMASLGIQVDLSWLGALVSWAL